MKNLAKITRGLLGLLCLLLIISCEKSSLEEFDDQEKIFEENLLEKDENNLEAPLHKQQNEDLGPLCEISRTDLALVLDVSGSMRISINGKTRLDAAKDGAKLLAGELNSNILAALVSYDDEAFRRLDLTMMDDDGRDELKAAIDRLDAELKFTNIQGGIIFGAEELTGNENLFDFVDTNPSGNDRGSADKIMVLLSDGDANRYYDKNGEVVFSNPEEASPKAKTAAETAKAAGIRIITIAIGEADRDFMRSLASSDEDFFTTDDINDLENLFQEITGSICPTQVQIDIKPGSDPNSINLRQKGVIPVAVLGTEEFDVMRIDPVTVRFGSLDAISNEEAASLAHTGGHFEDVDGDGRMDFVGHFATQDTGFSSDDGRGWLAGKTKDGESIAGRDRVRIVNGGNP